ncbi:MAG: helix-turn-helix domain-containing protein [Bacteroides sp.]|nr:helix-turn-helix domain-containing protein [Roseburia sp.]MCM1346462.1 helix-turn-helix domain-containing protein [Bacteroides sp.]MCM1420331.1 helix-turn-helix domain-containing protein [Bacteroides sp.]
MQRHIIVLVVALLYHATMALGAEHITIFEGPKRIESWEIVNIGAIEFQKLEIGDTVYVFTKDLGSNASAAFQNHEWKSIDEGVINGQIITGDFEMIVNNKKRLDELKNYGLKFTGCRLTVDKVVIKKHDDNQLDLLKAIGVFMVAMCLLSSVFLLYSYRKLKKANHALYLRTIEDLAQYDRERGLRSNYEGQIAALKEIIQNNGEMRKKYQNNRMDDEKKAVIARQILDIMENVEQICRQEMSLNYLAELIGFNYKDVSQVINETFNCNFNVLLNGYRIKEACRRLSNRKQYGNLTIEAVCESVGFKSRSTFISTFKKVTGLTPSEFLSSVREQER